MRLIRTLATLFFLAAVSPAAADPVLDWSRAHFAPADQPGGRGGTPPAPQTQPGQIQPVEPLFADVTGTAKPVSLVDILQLAVRQAPALASARLDVEIAEAQIQQAQSWSEWLIHGQASGETGYSSLTASRNSSVQLDASLMRPLSIGGAIGLSGTGIWSRGRTFTDFSGTSDIYSETVTATYQQHLLAGRGEAQVRARERAAAYSRDASQVAARGQAINVVRDVVLAYLDLVAAERDLEIRRSSLGLAQEQLRVTDAGIRGGGVAKAELIPVQQAIATREQDTLTGEYSVLDKSLALRRTVQMPIARGDALLSSTGDLAIPEKTWDQDRMVEAALANSPELARLKSLEAGATIEVEVTENGILPTLDLVLAFGPSGTADGPLTAAKNMVKFDEYTASGRLTYDTSWGRGAARGAAREQRATREKLRVNAIDVRNQVIEALTRAIAQVQVAERAYKISVRAVDLAEQNLQVEKARMTLGKSRNVDVMIRQDELRASQLAQARAIIDWHRAATVIAALTGEILPEYGVQLDK